MDKNKMLIDATHPEETRVVALRNGRVEEFDFESAARKLLRGNIYLAKVTRVEPSLQAAFIDYGGNRHGFLAFNEIHPDYYQIPIADREALKQEEAEAELRAEAEADERARSRGPRRRRRPRDRGNGERGAERSEGGHEVYSSEVDTFEDGYQTSGAPVIDSDHEPAAASAGLRHDASPDDVRHAIAEAPQPPPSTEERQAGPNAAEPLLEACAEAGSEPMRPVAATEAAPDSIPGDWTAGEGWASGAPQGEAAAATAEAIAHPGDPAQDTGADEADDHVEGDGAAEDETVEQVSSEEDALEELPERPRRRARQYKIQEVIKRRQIMLVQVVKEERGNKGAALTTYISLAGRYTVLMPNTARGGGISRKITQPQDRKRLKAVAEELDVSEGMGLIIRTAGAARTKQEIKRDYDYLLRLWESVRDLTLSSTAPCLVYEEGNIIKRAIRDLYSKDFDQIVVAGDAAHREAQDFMEMLMPGSRGQVASYRSPEPLFARYGIERQLNALFSPYVTLKSGGYIVINQTEALVSVDVNSGKSTREFSIEETALNTNIEAADEIARQLKLRDLAGLIVVDFIDMEEKRNNRYVERRLKDALRHDRARIQVGRISHFGLLEMSRQRLRAGVLEGSTSQCPHCQGTGIIRSIESVSLAVLRGLEDHLLKQPTSVIAQTTAEVALYILNHKRAFITEMERRYGVILRVEASDRMQGANFNLERIAAPAAPAASSPRAAVSMEWGFDREEEGSEDADELVAEQGADDRRLADDERPPRPDGGAGEEERRGRRRRRRRGRRDREGEPRDAPRAPEEGVAAAGLPDDHAEGAAERTATGSEETYEGADEAYGDAEPVEASTAQGEASEGDGGERRRGRRRGRRGGRARRREDGQPAIGGHVADDADRHEWGIAEVARPGAEQPSPYAQAPWHERARGLVGSVDAPPRGMAGERAARPSIVEQVSEEPAQSTADAAPFAACTAEAVRLAVALAGGAVRGPGNASLPQELPAAAASVTGATADMAPAMASGAAPAGLDESPLSFVQLKSPADESGEVIAVPPVSDDNVSHLAEREQRAPEPDREPASLTTVDEPSEARAPARRGWWQRRFGGAE